MYAVVQITDPPAPNVGKSYGALEFAKYGVCCWEYEVLTAGGGGIGAKGPVHWINFPDSVFRPEYPNPIAFHYFMAANVHAHVQVIPELFPYARDIIVQGIATSLLSGKGIPFFTP